MPKLADVEEVVLLTSFEMAHQKRNAALSLSLEEANTAFMARIMERASTEEVGSPHGA
jgi:hypothetical protein